MKEWRQIPGFEGIYSISIDGEVRRDCIGSGCGVSRTYIGKILRTNIMGQYKCVRLYKNTNPHRYTIHELLMLCFIGPRPLGYEINHKDGNKLNNNLSNLEYVTRKENAEHATKNNLYRVRENHGRAKLTWEDVRNIRKEYIPKKRGYGSNTLAIKYGVNPSVVRDILNNRIWRECGV